MNGLFTAHAAKLVIARENLDLLAGRPAFVVGLIHHLREAADQIEDAVLGPHLTPEFRHPDPVGQ